MPPLMMARFHMEVSSRDLMESYMVLRVQVVKIMGEQFSPLTLTRPPIQNLLTFLSTQVYQQETWCKLPMASSIYGPPEVFITMPAFFHLILLRKNWICPIIRILRTIVMEAWRLPMTETYTACRSTVEAMTADLYFLSTRHSLPLTS